MLRLLYPNVLSRNFFIVKLSLVILPGCSLAANFDQWPYAFPSVVDISEANKLCAWGGGWLGNTTLGHFV